jgi:hypothetical protein
MAQKVTPSSKVTQTKTETDGGHSSSSNTRLQAALKFVAHGSDIVASKTSLT